MARGWMPPVLLFSLFALGGVPAVAQDQTENPLFLIARPELQDPFFHESVVLMLPLPGDDPRLIVGLIVNKPIRIPLSQVFPKERSLRDRSDPVYFGGPVDTDTPGAVFRAPKPSGKAIHLFADLYISFDSDFIVGMLKKSKNDGSVRLFLGRAQWSPDQLQIEVLRRSWYSERAESSWIFSQSPQTVWRTLSDRARPSPIAQLGDTPLQAARRE